MAKVLLGMSGGIDSSVALSLLLEQGHDVTGITMDLFDKRKIFGTVDNLNIDEDRIGSRDIEDAVRVAHDFGIPHIVADFRKDFSLHVIDPFIDTYIKGNTPNPCVFCNRKIKFGILLDYALEKGFEYIATGHYAKIIKDDAKNRSFLAKGTDKKKDQSYFLYTLNQRQLEHMLLPLGDMTKDKVREKAVEMGFHIADKKDSQDICFIKDENYGEFIERYSGINIKKGDFLTKDGKAVGKHKGIVNYTIGQRKGLGVALGKPVFVIGKDLKSNSVILGDSEDLMSRELIVEGFIWNYDENIKGTVSVGCKTRSTQPCQPAKVTRMGSDRAKVVFEKEQRAFTPGQSAVFYIGDIVAGGGIIVGKTDV